MSCGDVVITIPGGVLNEAQTDRLREDLRFHHHADMTSDELHLIRSKVESHLRASGALEMSGTPDVELRERPITKTLTLRVERQLQLEDGTWGSWLPVDLSNPDMELKSGQRVRQRIRMLWQTGRFEGKVAEFQV